MNGGDLMAGYKPVTEQDAELFLKLYRKYLLSKVDEMKNILETLPTDVIERCFDGAKFIDKDFDLSKLDEATFGIGGLCGYKKILDIAGSLIYYRGLYEQGEEILAEALERFGHKVNFKKVGVRKK
jgi:hypothetical protein